MRDEKRWQKTWFFLSLDQIRPYFGELWVFLEDADKFQRDLREILNPWLDKDEYYDDYAPLNYLMVEWFQKQYGAEKLDYLICWARDILFYEGPDRVPETVWSHISYNSPALATELRLSSWVVELMTKLNADQERNMIVLKEKLVIDAQKHLSNWDAKILPIEYSEAEDIRNLVRLIGAYNIFLKSWEKHCSGLSHTELYEIYLVGKQVAAETGMQKLKVAFPGSWRFELRTILQKVAAWENR